MHHRILASPDPQSTLRAVTGPRAVPLFGALRLRSDPTGLAQDLRRAHGDIAFVTVLGRDVVVAQGPAAAAELVGDRDEAFANEPVYGFALGSLFERGILLMDADEHRRHRRILQTAFTRTRLDGYAQRLHPLVSSAMANFPTGDGVDMRIPLKAIALDLALEIFLGARLPRADADRMNRAFVELIEAAGALVRLPIPGTRWHRAQQAKTVLDDYMADVVSDRRRRPGADLMSALCSADIDGAGRLSDAEIVDHMRFMLFAAHDTATIAMTSMVYRLGRHRRWRDELRDEAIDLGTRPGLGELRSAVATDAVFRESVRLRPPVPVVPRAAIKDTELCGHLIPAGAFVIVPIGANHRRPDIWPDPARFDPGRFIGERDRRDHPMAWMPFGGGRHNCMGMHFAYLESAIVVHHLLEAYDWTVSSDAYERDDVALTENVGFLADVRPR